MSPMFARASACSRTRTRNIAQSSVCRGSSGVGATDRTTSRLAFEASTVHDRDAQRIKGYMADEIIGKSFTVFSSAADVRDGKPARKLAAAVSLGQHRDLSWRVRKDSSMFWANVVITAIVDAEGVLKGFAKVTRDETDRKRRRWYGSLTTSSQPCVLFEEFRTARTDFKRSPTWPWRNVRSCDCASRLAGGRGTSRGPLRRRR